MNDSPENQDIPDDRLPTDRRPLGRWLRVVDALISREFALALRGEDVDRRDWMLLNAIAGEVEAPELLAHLQRRPKRLRALIERGWVDDDGDDPELTDEGRAAMRRIGEKVAAIRTRVAGAVSPDDFATTLASLEAIARELGWDETMPTPEHGHRGGKGRRGGWGRRAGWGPGRFPSPSDAAFVAFARHTEFAGFPDGHGFGPHRHGHDFGRGFAYADEFGEHRGHRGEHPRHPGHGHHGRPGFPGEDATERAYERGFQAGFTRGRDATSDAASGSDAA